MKMYLIVIFCFSLPNLVFADSIDAFVEKVKKSNLEITAQNSIVSASEARSKGLSLKAPMVGVNQMRTLEEGIAYAYEIQQEVPLSSRLGRDKQLRMHAYELQKKESEFFSVEKLLEARIAFVGYWKDYEKINYLTEVRDWLKQHLSYARSVVRSDPNSNIYALEIESYLGVLENDLSSVQSDLEAQKAKLNFVTDISKCEGYDLLLAKGSLQYLEWELHDKLVELKQRPRYLIINMTPLHPKLKTITLNSIGTAFCPYHIRKEDDFFNGLKKVGYDVLDIWNNEEKKCNIAFESERSLSYYKGAILKLSPTRE